MIYNSEEPVEQLADKYFTENRDYEADIQRFQQSIAQRAPKTIRTCLAIIKSFLIENDVELSQRFWRRCSRRVRGSRPLTQDRIPTKEELREILQHLPISSRALFSLLASSGMRIGEALKLHLNDVDLHSTPLHITIRGEYTKTGNGRVTFASKETKQLILAWLKIRDEYLQTAVKRSNRHPKSKNDPRLFPYSRNNARFMWTQALQRSNHAQRDARTHIHILHPHVLRKFFRTNLATVIPRDAVEALMGHQGYLTAAYRRFSTNKLSEIYLQGEHVLTVFSNTHNLEKLQTNIKSFQTVVSGLAVENTGLKTQLHEMEQNLTEQQQDLDHYHKRLDYFFKTALPSFIESGELTTIMEQYIDRKMMELHKQLREDLFEIAEDEERFQESFEN
jgi:integrase